MRTTLNIDDHVHRDVKRHAADRGRTITEVVEQALREFLADREEGPATSEPTRLPSFDGGDAPGVQPGVDLTDNAALLDLMDGLA